MSVVGLKSGSNFPQLHSVLYSYGSLPSFADYGDIPLHQMKADHAFYLGRFYLDQGC